MNPLLSYTLMRLGLLLVVGAVLFTAGTRGWLWIALTVVVSAALSYLVLKAPRDRVAQRIAARAAGNVNRNALDKRISDDNAAEDAAAEALRREGTESGRS